jgi:limonene-1,2-epoxide hydrolase
MATESERVVDEFCKTWTTLNIDKVMEFFTDDAVYHNIPFEPAKGKEAIRGVFNTLILPGVKSLHFKVLHSASNGNRVFNERVDSFDLDNGKTISLPVAGVFEVTGSKISAWRDYFDVATYTKQMQ